MCDVVALGELLIDFAPVSTDEAGCPTLKAQPGGVHVVDTTGAGDIFGGSAMSRFLRLNKAPEDLSAEEMAAAARFACCAASLSTQAHGGIASIVPEEEVLRTV